LRCEKQHGKRQHAPRKRTCRRRQFAWGRSAIRVRQSTVPFQHAAS
jgi:hypothetical protein